MIQVLLKGPFWDCYLILLCDHLGVICSYEEHTCENSSWVSLFCSLFDLAKHANCKCWKGDSMLLLFRHLIDSCIRLANTVSLITLTCCGTHFMPSCQMTMSWALTGLFCQTNLEPLQLPVSVSHVQRCVILFIPFHFPSPQIKTLVFGFQKQNYILTLHYIKLIYICNLLFTLLYINVPKTC